MTGVGSEGGGAVQRDRSSSVQIFSQRFDDFYILFIITLGGRMRHVVPIYTIYYIIIIQRIISSMPLCTITLLRFPRAAAHSAIVVPPPPGGDDYDDTPGENRAAAAHITIILYFIVIYYIAYCVRARIRLRNGKNGFFCVRARSRLCCVLYKLVPILYYYITILCLRVMVFYYYYCYCNVAPT